VPTYLYGLVRADRAKRVPDSLVGLRGSPVRTLKCNSLAALVGDVERVPPPSVDDVRAHDQVSQRAVEAGLTVIAVRYGQAFETDENCAIHVEERADRLVRVLNDYDGCVEMRILLPHGLAERQEAQPTTTGPGRAYLERVRTTMAKDVAGLALRDAIGAVVQLERVDALRKARGIAFSHLVRREDVQAYRDSVMALPGLAQAKIVGPVAIYALPEYP